MASEPPSHGQQLRSLLREARRGMLSTLSLRHGGGHPFGSVVPFALWSSGEPLFWLSDLAAHTKNLVADARASFLVLDPRSTDIQPPRATLVGRCTVLAGEAQAAARDLFGARHPESAALNLPGFAAFVLHVDEVRWVGGFAAAAWLDGKALRAP